MTTKTIEPVTEEELYTIGGETLGDLFNYFEESGTRSYDMEQMDAIDELSISDKEKELLKQPIKERYK